MIGPDRIANVHAHLPADMHVPAETREDVCWRTATRIFGWNL